jgi:hypothetical protein
LNYRALSLIIWIATARLPAEETAHVLIVRCAWCRRYEVGEIWLGEKTVHSFLRNDPVQVFTHGICPDCIANHGQRGLGHEAGR